MTDWSDHRDFLITTFIVTVSIVTPNFRLGRLVVRNCGNCNYRGHRSRCLRSTVSVLHRGGTRDWRRLVGLTCTVQLSVGCTAQHLTELLIKIKKLRRLPEFFWWIRIIRMTFRRDKCVPSSRNQWWSKPLDNPVWSYGYGRRSLLIGRHSLRGSHHPCG